MKIHNYESSSGRDLILDYIMNLTEEEKVDAFSVLEDMENGKMDCLTTKRWYGKVWEVYFRKHNRIFYVTVDGMDTYLLHACRKQKNKTEKKDKNTVIKRAKELGNILKRNFI
ncbi:MAG: type II toxin-antitoxin system RelE/ParE family toxin [Lachnospiraceae bacterium]|nr:type II toxin-antitoxin system RelE/ParE family toxin [Lachnospiraceae bacterium]